MAYTEIKFTGEGISITLYEGMRMVDEYWATWSEVEELKESEGADTRVLE